jgi:hypothetical protein
MPPCSIFRELMFLALRLYPSVPVNSRTALRTTIFPTGGGKDRQSPVLIHKGAAVAYSVYSLHRRPDLYGDDAEDFRPERWEEELGLFKDETTARWGYLPFNGGPRICLGSEFGVKSKHRVDADIYLIVDFAMTEAAYTIVRILQRFPNIEKPHDEPYEKIGKEQQTMTMVVSITKGCRVQCST